MNKTLSAGAIMVAAMVAGLLAARVDVAASPPERRLLMTTYTDFRALCGEPIAIEDCPFEDAAEHLAANSCPPGIICGVVDENSELCPGGTFEDHTQGISRGVTLDPDNPSPIALSAVIKRVYDCGDGTFEESFNPHSSDGIYLTEDHFVLGQGTGIYEGIHGQGDWSIEVNFDFVPCQLICGVDHHDGFAFDRD